MATITVVTASPNGAALSMVSAAAGGDAFNNNGKTLYRVTNGGGSSINVTITPVNTTPQGYTISPIVVAVANGTTKDLGPYDPSVFNNSAGQVPVAYSAVTSVTVGALSLP